MNATPDVLLLPLGGDGGKQLDAIRSLLNATVPSGKTPLIDAYESVVRREVNGGSGAFAESATIVLVTDGLGSLDRNCLDPCVTADVCTVRKITYLDDAHPVDAPPLIDAIASAYSNYGIKTLVVGTMGCETRSSRIVASGLRRWVSDARVRSYGGSNRLSCGFTLRRNPT